MRFPQRITFTGTMTVDAEGLDWKTATQVVKDALLEADPRSLDVIRVTKLEVVEED